MVVEKKLKGKSVYLRSCGVDDAEFTRALRQDPRITKYLPAINNTLEQQEDWIRMQREKPGDYFFVIWDVDSGERIGTTSLYDIHMDECEFGRMICTGGSKYSTEAVLLLFEFGFDVLELKSIRCYAYCDNARAIRFYEKMGFEKTGVDEDKNGTPVLKMALTRERYEDSILSMGNIYAKRYGTMLPETGD